jgi:lipopolysaccharide assembly outer membrane protein LptD (OstA)
MQAQTTSMVSVDTKSDSVTLFSATRLTFSEGYYDLYENVEVTVGQMRLTADHVRIYKESNDLTAEGNVVLTLGDQSIRVRNLEWKKSEPDKATITFD